MYYVGPLDSKKANTTTKQDSDEAFLLRYEVDRRSIYVGNLSLSIDDDTLKQIFGEAGVIRELQVLRKFPENMGKLGTKDS